LTDRTDLRVAVLGVGRMGADHVARLHHQIVGAQVTVVSDVCVDRATAIALGAPGSRVVADPFEAIAADDVDAVVIASTSAAHEEQVLACLASGRPVLCEKPLTTTARTSLEIVRTEAKLDSPLVQVGFMRRFDDDYVELKRQLDSGAIGQPLLLHCAHRNLTAPVGYTSTNSINESLVHEIDATRFLLGEEIAAITVHRPTANSAAPVGLHDPLLVLMETGSGRLVDVEVFITYGTYEVRAEVVGESGSATLGTTRHSTDFRDYFQQAYRSELQSWVNAVRSGTNVDGPGTWDGYAAAAVCEAGVASLQTGQRTEVHLTPVRASNP
jgi:myo-inositol 2-dehydrogenase / D-chiro-inositol 1-dehydrogenase